LPKDHAKRIKRCHNQAKKGLGRLRIAFTVYLTLSQPG
jgi:hypothetical protein